jgi:hypothetical protein
VLEGTQYFPGLTRKRSPPNRSRTRTIHELPYQGVCMTFTTGELVRYPFPEVGFGTLGPQCSRLTCSGDCIFQIPASSLLVESDQALGEVEMARS